MKIYKVKLCTRIFISCVFLLLFIVGGIVFLILNKEATILQRVIMFGTILMGIDGIRIFNNIKVIIDDRKIEVVHIRFLLRTGTLYWTEITKLTSEYFLYPETGGINLISNSHGGKKFLRISMWGMPIELVRDILSHLPPDTKVNLYPYLKRKLEGKQTWFYVK